MSTKTLIIIIVIILAAALAVYFSGLYKKLLPGEKAEERGMPQFQFSPDVGGQVGKATGNPLAEMPSTNPLEQVANPFEDSYHNPFE